YADDRTWHRKDWPTSGRKLSGELRRLAPNLRRAGIEVIFERHTNKGTPIRLEQIRKTPSPSSPPSPDPRSDDPLAGHEQANPAATAPSPPIKPIRRQENDEGDESDDVFQSRSGSPTPLLEQNDDTGWVPWQ